MAKTREYVKIPLDEWHNERNRMYNRGQDSGRKELANSLADLLWPILEEKVLDAIQKYHEQNSD